MVIPQYLPSLFKPIIAAASAEVGFAINYEWGHKKHVSGILDQKDQAKNKTPKFPLIWLVMDFKEVKGDIVQVYSKTNLSFVFCVNTKIDYTSQQREDITYVPKLLPMYAAFINAISNSTTFRMPTATLIGHEMILRHYWGEGGVNLFNDYVDCIEITNLKLDVRAVQCAPSTSQYL